MRRIIPVALTFTRALAWTHLRSGYVPGNDFGVPQNASYDYVIVEGGDSRQTHASLLFFFFKKKALLVNSSIPPGRKQH